MEELKQSKILKVLFIVFIFISIIHVLYASLTYRGLYSDGVFYMIKQLNWLSDGVFSIAFDPGHPRFFSLVITQLPIIIAHSLFFIKNKFILMFIYSFFQFAIPLAFLFWSYKLAKRTKKPDIFFWNLFTYGCIVLLYEIFSVTENIQCIALHFILWNYLTAKIEYTKKDILFIIFLIGAMFFSFEYVAYLGIFFFLCHFHYVLEDNSVKNQSIKTLIGFGSLGASIYTIWYMIHEEGEGGEILRFIAEGINVIPFMLNLNSLLSIITILLLTIFLFKKSSFKVLEIAILTVLFFIALQYLLHNIDMSLSPMWEGHFRPIPCVWILLVFLIIHIKDLISQQYNLERWHNMLCIVLLCTIFQTFWQINNTYYWNKNIQYMKEELKQSKNPLYIPVEHDEISSFANKNYRRYIWHAFYAVTGIVFSDTYKQNSLLVNYDSEYDRSNLTFRKFLYVLPDNTNRMSLPVGVTVNIKNDYWDLTDCAKALDEYNKKHNIETEM